MYLVRLFYIFAYSNVCNVLKRKRQAEAKLKIMYLMCMRVCVYNINYTDEGIAPSIFASLSESGDKKRKRDEEEGNHAGLKDIINALPGV